MLPPSGSSGLRPAWWQRLRFVYRHADLRPSNQLSPISAGRHPTYKVSGDDPQFRLRHILPAGWYMVEVELHCEHVVGHSRFYLDHGHGESEALSHGLPCRNGKVSKRLLYLKSPARLRYDPVTAPCLLEVRHFRLVRMTPGAALQRLRRKLENHRTLVGGAWPSDDDLEAAWSAYDGLFSQDAGTTSSYASWIQQVEQPLIADLTEQRRTVSQWARRPLVSIVLPTWNTPVPLLRACLDSVLAQSYPHWELCVADDASTEPHVRRVLSAYASRDERIRVTYRPRNGHICEASNTALEMAGGEFVALLDHDDVLAPHALFFMVRALQDHPEARLVYSDEDKLDSEGRRCDPFFKPDWSPDLLRAQNYICHLCMLQRQLVKTVGGFRAGYEGSQDYDLVLRCTEHLSEPGQIVHVPMVLYHWRQTEGSTAGGHQAKDYATGAAVRALEDHMQRTRTGARVSVIAPGLYRSHWPLPPAPPLVSLIIPTRDAHDVLRTCIESILGKTTYPHLELLVVDNQSTCQQTMSYLDELTRQEAGRVRVLRHDQPFNYSAINNMAARHAKGSILGLINNDIEVISPGWLTEMVSHAVRPDIGCVGA
ncbi:MAG: glycosyltransferase, partial [Burkholderiales bacterium]